MPEDRDNMRAGQAQPGRSPGKTGGAPERARPDGPISLLDQLADFAMQTGEYGTAAEYYEQMLEMARRLRTSDEALVAVYQKIATCLRAGGDYDRALSFLGEAETLLTRAPSVDSVKLAEVLGDKAWIAVRQGNYDLAERDGLRALELAGDPARESAAAWALNCLGTVALRRGQWDKAREIYEGALAIYLRLDNQERVARCYNNLGIVAKNLGHPEEALRFQRAAVRISRGLGKELESAGQLNNLGITLFKRGEWTEAFRCWEEALSIFERQGERWEITYVHASLGNYHRRMHRWEEADRHYRRSLELAERNGDVRGRALAIEFLGCLAAETGDTPRARELLQEAMAVARGIAPRGDLMIELHRAMAEASLQAADWEVASSHALQGLSLAVATSDVLEEGSLHRALARIAGARGEIEDARQHVSRAIECHRQVGEPYELARSLCVAADIELLSPAAAAKEGALRAASEGLREAEEIFRSLGAAYEAGRTQLREARCLAHLGEGERAGKALDLAAQEMISTGGPAGDDEIHSVRALIDRSLASASVSDTNDLAAFAEMAAEINALARVEDRLQRILERAARRADAQRARLAIWDGDLEKPLIRLDWKESASEPPLREPWAAGVIHLAAGENLPLVATQPAADARFSSLHVPREVVTVLCLPLLAEGRAVGGIYLDRTRRPAAVSQDRIDLAVALASLATAGSSELLARHQARQEGADTLPPGADPRFPYLLTRDGGMRSILDSVEKLQSLQVTVLLCGETGTGKELIAQAIHGSNGPDRPFVTIHCAAVAEGVLESELFGHVRGAYTDAHQDTQGLFERAHGGTVFLDEIDKTSRGFQEKILRVVDKGEFMAVGSNETRRTRFRIVCATNRDLAKDVEEGRFLKDLYYRLKVVQITLPPLRERRDDVPLLAEHFLRGCSKRLGRRGLRFSEEAVVALARYDWPGNVRDLEHEVERAVAFSSDGEVIGLDRLTPEVAGQPATQTPHGALAQAIETLEVQLIREALRRYAGNRSRAARSLGLSRRGLLNKLERYGLTEFALPHEAA